MPQFFCEAQILVVYWWHISFVVVFVCVFPWCPGVMWPAVIKNTHLEQ